MQIFIKLILRNITIAFSHACDRAVSCGGIADIFTVPDDKLRFKGGGRGYDTKLDGQNRHHHAS